MRRRLARASFLFSCPCGDICCSGKGRVSGPRSAGGLSLLTPYCRYAWRLRELWRPLRSLSPLVLRSPCSLSPSTQRGLCHPWCTAQLRCFRAEPENNGEAWQSSQRPCNCCWFASVNNGSSKLSSGNYVCHLPVHCLKPQPGWAAPQADLWQT